MSTANFKGHLVVHRNHMQASFLLSVMLIGNKGSRGIDTLNDYVLFFWLFYAHHLYLFVAHFNDLGEGNFADLAFELVEIVALDKTLKLFLYLTVDPLFKAINMDDAAVTLALAWRNQHVLFCLFVA